MRQTPLLYIIATSVMAGLCLALVLAAIVTASIWAASQDWELALYVGGRLAVLLLIACPAGICGVMMIRVLPQKLEEGALEPFRLPSESTTFPPYVSDPTIGEQIKASALHQIEWYYVDDKAPTRDAMCQATGMPQTIWNSGRDVLKAIGLVNDEGWLQIGLRGARALVNRVGVEGDKLWYPLAGADNQLRFLWILEGPEGNRYTAPSE